MPSHLGRSLFILFAPISVPVYLLLLVAAQVVGAAYYLVVEATLARIMGRSIALTRVHFIVFAIPVLALAPLAAALHLVLFVFRWLGRTCYGLGFWQAGSTSRAAAFSTGLLWVLAALWVSITCMNAALGSALIGRPLAGREAFLDGYRRDRAMKELPPDMQARRARLIEELTDQKQAATPHWDVLVRLLEDDDVGFRALPQLIGARLAGMPWYFIPGEISPDGADHSMLFLPPLLFAWLLLVRWPGMLGIVASPPARTILFLVRMAMAVGAIYAVISWSPASPTWYFEFESDKPGRWFLLASPASWLSIDWGPATRPDWYLLNMALWIMLIGLIGYLSWLAWRIAPMIGWPRHYVPFLATRLLQRKRIAFFSVGAVTLCVAMMIIVISVMGGFVDSIRERAHGLLGDLVLDGGLQGFPYYAEFIEKLKGLRDEKTGQPLIVEATPLIHSYGILQFPHTKKTAAISILGIRLDEYVRVNEFGKDLFYHIRYGGTKFAPQGQPTWAFTRDRIPALPDELERHYQEYVQRLSPAQRAEELASFARQPGELYPGPGIFQGPTSRPAYEGKPYPGVIIGRSILFRRMGNGEFRRYDEYPRGQACQITVMPLTRSGDISPESPPKPAFRYVDDSRTGIHEIDSKNVYVDFDELQRLLSMGPQRRTDGTMASARCTQIQVKVSAPWCDSREKLDQVKKRAWALWREHRFDVPADALEVQMLGNVDLQTWEEMQASYISAIEKEKFLVLIMFGVISVVAVFLILCIFYMIVQEKTRDIGIIKSVGGSAAGVAAVFLAYGGAIGLVGCVLGSILGISFVQNINDIQDWLARLNPEWRVWSPETYSFDRIPDVWKWSEVIGISILAIVSSIVGAAFPAIRASRTWPVESLRYE